MRNPAVVVVTFDDGDVEVFGPWISQAGVNAWLDKVWQFLAPRHPKYLVTQCSDPQHVATAASI